MGVSWHEAQAFAAWLGAQRFEGIAPGVTVPEGYAFRLPSEAEWEKAARGADGRLWPWGDVFEENRANTGEAGLEETSAVGAFSAGASPCGAQDLAGNVWEWTGTLWSQGPIELPSFGDPYDPLDGRESPAEAGPRVMRGGAWTDSRWARCASRGRIFVEYFKLVGVRVVLSLAYSES